jgi:hypothetical protein
VPPANELGDEHSVPEIDVLAPGGGYDFGVAHVNIRPREFD